MTTATIEFTQAAQRELAISMIKTIDPEARVYPLKEGQGNWIEFDITEKIGSSVKSFVDAANDSGHGPFFYGVCCPV